MTDSSASLNVLRKLEEGSIDVDEAVRQLDGAPTAAPPPEPVVRRSQSWWLIPLAVGMTLLGAGGWLASLGGGWWILAVPLLLFGTLVTVLAAASSQSPWVFVRVRGRHSPHVHVWLPIPIRAAAWSVELARPWIPSLTATSIDDLLVSLEAELGAGRNLIIEVDEAGEGERVRVSFE